MKKAIVFAAAMAVGVAATCVAAEDRTVTEPDTVQADVEYGRLIVNAGLTVAAGVKLTCDTLCIASNIVGSATLTLEEGAMLTVTSASSRCVLLGAAGGQAYLVLKSGSTMTADGLSGAYGYVDSVAKNATPTRSFVTISNATLTLNGTYKTGTNKSANGLLFNGGGNWPSGTAATDVVDTIQLDEGAVLSVARINKSSTNAAKILFNGGKIVQGGASPASATKVAYFSSEYASRSSPFYLEATNGCPVSFEMSGSTYLATMFGFGSASCAVYVCGDGDFVLGGDVSFPLVNDGSQYWSNKTPNLRLAHDGKCRIAGSGTISLGASNICTNNGTTVTSHDWVVESGATFNLGGKNALMRSITVSPSATLKNSSETVSELTLGDGDVDVSYLAPLPLRINVRKIGSGSLSMLAADLANVSVESGVLKLMGRAEIGYPFYKFNVYATGSVGGKNAQARIGELVYLNGEEDVTQGWTELYYDPKGTGQYNSPTKAIDGDLTTFFFDQRAQNYSTVSNIHFELEYAMPRKVSGYKWTYHTGTDNYNSNPTSWEVFGSDDNETWESLDYVEYQKAGWTGWTKRTCVYPASQATLATAEIAEGACLSVVGATVDLTGANLAAGVGISVSAGGTMVLPAGTDISDVSADATVSGGTIRNFAAAASGTLKVTGTGATVPKKLGILVPDAVADMSAWTVTYNGTPVDYIPVVKDGEIVLKSTRGLFLLVR